MIDVTQLKESEIKLQAARQAADAANNAKSDFLSSMSHELRTPLTSIIGFADLMLLREPGDANRRYLELQRDSGKHLLALINDILDHSKIEAGKLHLECVPFDLRGVIDGCREVLAIEAARKGLHLETTVGVTVPRQVVGDPGRLKQVVLNLMGNAIKFTEAGMVSLDVTLQGVAGDVAALAFDIRDTGIGIAPERTPHLFERYMQAESSTTRRYGGTGLGLSISKSLVEAMGRTDRRREHARHRQHLLVQYPAIVCRTACARAGENRADAGQAARSHPAGRRFDGEPASVQRAADRARP